MKTSKPEKRALVLLRLIDSATEYHGARLARTFYATRPPVDGWVRRIPRLVSDGRADPRHCYVGTDAEHELLVRIGEPGDARALQSLLSRGLIITNPALVGYCYGTSLDGRRMVEELREESNRNLLALGGPEWFDVCERDEYGEQVTPKAAAPRSGLPGLEGPGVER